jgi:hypothetical protein
VIRTVCFLIVIVGLATAGADEPLRIGIVRLKPALAEPALARRADRQSVENRILETDRNKLGLGAFLGDRAMRVEPVALGQDPPELEVYDVVVLIPEWTWMLPDIDAHAKACHTYLAQGGGLVVFQPNPFTLAYPPGAPKPAGLPEDHNGYAAPKLLPYPVCFCNSYVKQEGVRKVDDTHPISAGLTDESMPFPSDRMFDLSPKYQVLAIGVQSESPSLAVTTFGQGRCVLIADNVFGTTDRALPCHVVQRSILWASGAEDKEVRRIGPKQSHD